ncbi:MAG: hypothetical protein ACTS8S_08880 [Giesbergeria sp.]
MRQRTIAIVLSAVASAAALLLSWPYMRDFEYWAESRIAWLIYFVVGFVLAVYVFYVFLRVTRTLFEHDALEHEAAAKAAGTQSPNSDSGEQP